jgi:elongation factor Ts
MANYTAADVKKLRDATGAGMMDAKKALETTDGDFEKAIEELRIHGAAKAAKRGAERSASNGLVAAAENALVQLNCETDFVAKNEQFQEFVREVSKLALDAGGDVEALKNAAYPGGATVADKLTDNIATIGENQSLRRTAVLEVPEGAVVSYVHNAAAPGMGKIGVLVALESRAPAEALQALGKQIAMHIAAANPLALDAEGLDASLLERERAIAIEKANESGKPANIVEKMVDGTMAKFRKEHSLLSQLFVMDNKTPVADVVAAASKEAGSPITLKAFERFQLGEGIAKAESDFAAEVAAAAGVQKDEPVA